MVGRREKLRRIVNNAFFDEGNRLKVDARSRYDISPPRPSVDDAGFGQAWTRISDDSDDFLVVPGQIAVRVGSAAEAALRRHPGFQPGPPPAGSRVVIFEWASGDRSARSTNETLRVIGDLAAIPSATHDIAPVYGFRAHQTNHHTDEPWPTELVPEPDGPEGEGIRIFVLDTGVNATGPWVGGHITGDQDPLVSAEPGALPAPNLAFAAGHGNHVAGVVHQVVPSADIVVRRAVTSDGFVSEPALFAILRQIASEEPDIVVVPLGGPALQLGSFGTRGNGQDWLEPQLLLDGLEQLVEASPATLIVASAGNDESSDLCFPAAFTAVAASGALQARMVAVAALDHCGFRASFSNYGPWVSASSLGEHIRSMYVEGVWPAAHDPDGIALDFRGNPYARWSGTSFSAPAVAGLIALRTWNLRNGGAPGTTAVDGWNDLRAHAGPADPLLGVKLPAPMVAST